MKRIAIVCTLLCFLGVTALSAQNQGDMYISGSIGMNGSSSKLTAGNTTVKSPGGFQMSITPQFGYFIIDNLELHLGLGYSFTKEPDDDKSSTNTSLFVINPGVNYYLPIVENKFFIVWSYEFLCIAVFAFFRVPASPELRYLVQGRRSYIFVDVV